MSTPHDPPAAALRGGGCCGAVRYEVPDSFAYAMNCHCSDCRKATGSAFKAMAGIERDRLTITAGEDHLWILGDSHGHDARCRDLPQHDRY